MTLGDWEPKLQGSKMDPSVTQHSENMNYIMLTIYVNNEYDVDTISIVIVSGIL